MDIDGQEAMRLSWKAPQERHCSAVSTATFFVAWQGLFSKMWRDIFMSEQGYHDACRPIFTHFLK